MYRGCLFGWSLSAHEAVLVVGRVLMFLGIAQRVKRDFRIPRFELGLGLPVDLSGAVPLRLPFGTVSISISVNMVPDAGLSLTLTLVSETAFVSQITLLIVNLMFARLRITPRSNGT